MSIRYTALAKAESAWNAAADENNQWDTLDFDEKLDLYEAAKRDEQPVGLCIDEGCPQYSKEHVCYSLKPCPFCGGDAKAFQFDRAKAFVVCQRCNGKMECPYPCKEDAIKLWNKRVTERELSWQPIETAPDGWILVPREDGLYSKQRIVCRCDERDKGYGVSYLDEELNALEINPAVWMPLTKTTSIEGGHS